jgi:DNA-binding Lrp family transcriptional regulator
MENVNYVLVNTELGEEINVAEKMRKIPNVVKAQAVFGVYDIIAEIKSKNMDEHKKVVAEDIEELRI